MRSCLRNVRLPVGLQSKLGEETTRGNHVNMQLCKVELKVNVEQSRRELKHKETVTEGKKLQRHKQNLFKPHSYQENKQKIDVVYWNKT